MSKSIITLGGFSEGSWQVKRFSRRLQARGYQLSSSIHAADIVVAHSGASILMPTLRDTQQLVLINPVYWPGKSLSRRAMKMTLLMFYYLRPGNHVLYHVYKTAHNFYYVLRHLRSNLQMVRRGLTYDLRTTIASQPTILIRTAGDPWITPNLDSLVAVNPDIRILRTYGEHDDCWQDPDRYIDLIESAL